ncbi:MAG: GTP-binding protein [Candidatus Omnitrophica bacterium]|nr:GTP-binding protein [Candidatus Omnitrophota bacterium]
MERNSRTTMNVVIVGHVDHGKSTLVGRLLADTDSLPDGKLQQVRQICARNAKPFEYAFLLDALKEEQSQGITIDSARCFFKSRKRKYLIIDAPGHIEFLKNMVSGAARAEAALLVIDAKEGIQANSKRHGYLLAMLGIKQIAVCVNKMDLVDYREDVFKKIKTEYTQFLRDIGIVPKKFIPASAREGDNVAGRSKKLCWFKGPTILSALDSFEEKPDAGQSPFRMPVQGVYKFTEAGDDRRIIVGRVESGSVAVGDKVIFLPSYKYAEIKSIEELNVRRKTRVSAGASTGFCLKDQIYVHRGEVMCKAGEELPFISSLIRVRLFWMGKSPLIFDKEYQLKIATAKVRVKLREIKSTLDASTLKALKKKIVDRHDAAECILECSSPIAFDPSAKVPATGRFVIVDHYDIAGGGIIAARVADEQTKVRQQVFLRQQRWEQGGISSEDRVRIYGHPARLILLTGESRFDKKIIAKQVEKKLFELGKKVYFLGIGNLLRGLDADVERDRVSRCEHVRRLGEVAHLMLDAGLIVVATASGLSDEELKMVQEVVSREAIMIVNLGEDHFRDGIVDLRLDPKVSLTKNTLKILKLLESREKRV